MRQQLSDRVEHEMPLPDDPEDESLADTPPWTSVDTLGVIWSGVVVVAWVFSWFWFEAFGCVVNSFSGCERSVRGIWLGLGIVLAILGGIAATIGANTRKRSIGWGVWVALTLVWFAVGTVAYGTVGY